MRRQVAGADVTALNQAISDEVGGQVERSQITDSLRGVIAQRFLVQLVPGFYIYRQNLCDPDFQAQYGQAWGQRYAQQQARNPQLPPFTAWVAQQCEEAARGNSTDEQFGKMLAARGMDLQ